MGSSNYIFEQGETLFYIGIILGALLLSFTAFQFYKIIKKEPYFYGRDDNNKHAARLGPAIGLGILGMLMICSMPRERNFYRRIKDGRAEAIGTTLEKVQEGHFKEIKYKFIVNGKAYYAECEYTYDGVQIEGIIVPNGHYKVIYNKNNPEESVMDFKANTDSLNN